MTRAWSDIHEAEPVDLEVQAEALLDSVPVAWRRQAEAEIDTTERMPSHTLDYQSAKRWLSLFVRLAVLAAQPWPPFAEVHRRLVRLYPGSFPSHVELFLALVADKQVSSRHSGPGADVAWLRAQPVLCLDGEPGVGKTMFAELVADVLGLGFATLSLGGQADSIAIRGVNRSYTLSAPGLLLTAVAEAAGGVVCLDEVDKAADSGRGDPQAALLEVLDPAQRHRFRDDFFQQSVDLSSTVFIVTTNNAASMPAPLQDRMHIVQVAPLTAGQKRAVLVDRLIPDLLDNSPWLSLAPDVPDALLHGDATPGLRTVQKRLVTLRGVASRRLLTEDLDRVVLTRADVDSLLTENAAPSWPRPRRGPGHAIAPRRIR